MSPWDPLSRSYGVNLPSSLTVSLSSALVCSTRPRVSVYGTGGPRIGDSGFSREHGYRRCPIARGLSVLSGSARGADLPAPHIPTPFNGLFRQPAAVSLLRPRFSPWPSNGIFTVSAIGSAFRLPLRSRLTLIRLALIRKPWSFGVGVSRPHYRYLCLHLLFHNLQPGSRPAFDGDGMLPYRWCSKHHPTASVPDLCPIIIHAIPLDQ